MKGDPKVIDLLNEVLKAELTAINQYFLHAEMCHDWGYDALYARTRRESIDEMKHAEWLIERILFLEGMPVMSNLFPLRIGQNVKDQFKNDVQLEYEAVERLNRGIALCQETGDEGSKMLLERILQDEEEHIDWIESQLNLIEELGLEKYLSQQMYAEK